MIQFQEIPYLRPDLDGLERQMGAGIAALEGAGAIPEAYYALLSLEAPHLHDPVHPCGGAEHHGHQRQILGRRAELV